jgi:sphinganine C4-monooxygenase
MIVLLAAWHARHHRLYVPYAYGALYNHPVEGFFMDTLGAVVSYKASFMSARMGMYFFVGSMMKTVDDHCGYALPWDPLQHLTSNNAAYHDIHHQSWGIKTNYSQPFFTFWDRITGTRYEGDTRLKYARTRASAEAKQNGVTVHANGNGKANGHGSMTVPPEKLD